jgi:hypothetical protein
MIKIIKIFEITDFILEQRNNKILLQTIFQQLKQVSI